MALTDCLKGRIRRQEGSVPRACPRQDVSCCACFHTRARCVVQHPRLAPPISLIHARGCPPGRSTVFIPLKDINGKIACPEASENLLYDERSNSYASLSWLLLPRRPATDIPSPDRVCSFSCDVKGRRRWTWRRGYEQSTCRLVGARRMAERMASPLAFAV